MLLKNPFRRQQASPGATTTGLWNIDDRRAAILAVPNDRRADAGDAGGKNESDKPYELTAGVAIIPIHGVMKKNPDFWDRWFDSCCSTSRIGEAVCAATADPQVQSILLLISSPGGTVAGTAELADAVATARAAKPVMAFIEDCGCSAAYWVASQAKTIMCNQVGFVGSIGTFCVLQDSTSLQDKIGLKLTVVSTGEFKGLGSDGKVSDKLVADI